VMVEEPFGLTVPLSVAPVGVTELAALVATVGAELSRVLPSSHSTVKTRRRTRRDRLPDLATAAPDSAGGSVSVDDRRRERRDRSC
jgi:hypothetical protein